MDSKDLDQAVTNFNGFEIEVDDAINEYLDYMKARGKPFSVAEYRKTIIKSTRKDVGEDS